MLPESIEERERRLQRLKHMSKERIEAQTAEERVNILEVLQRNNAT